MTPSHPPRGEENCILLSYNDKFFLLIEGKAPPSGGREGSLITLDN
jgi:hypothetical protein